MNYHATMRRLHARNAARRAHGKPMPATRTVLKYSPFLLILSAILQLPSALSRSQKGGKD